MEEKIIIPVYANYVICTKIDVPVSRAILARDYKGPGTGTETSTLVIEVCKKS